MTRREERLINALTGCIRRGEFTPDYAALLLEDGKYSWVSDTAKDAFHAQTAALLDTGDPVELCKSAVDDIAIEGGERVLVEISDIVPEGYVIGAYRQISFSDASDAGQNFKICGISHFSTSGGGKIAQIAVRNHGDEPAKVRVSVTVLAVKEA